MGDHGAWNGFNRLSNTKNTFEWVSGEKVEFTNWNTGEPNKRYRCVHMKYNYQHKWHTEPCLTKQKYVCEKGLFSFFFLVVNKSQSKNLHCRFTDADKKKKWIIRIRSSIFLEQITPTFNELEDSQR